MNTKTGRMALLVLIPFLFSCATITVNVYFPDKDVEAAYEDIERGLDFDVTPTRKDTATAPAKTKTKSQAFFGATQAWAEGRININAELEKMEDVQASLERRKDRIETFAALLDRHVVGISKDAMLARLKVLSSEEMAGAIADIFGVAADTASRQLDKFIADENKDRKILIRGMAVATLRATEQDETDKSALAEAVEKSTLLFVKSQMKKLKDAWYYQTDDGKWVQVEPPEEAKDKKKE